MIIGLLIAIADDDYAEHLSRFLSEKYSDTFAVSVCSSVDRLRDLLTANRYDTALLEPAFTSAVNLESVHLPLLLTDESEHFADDNSKLKKIRKYQQISSIAGNVLEYYAEVSNRSSNFGAKKAHIAAVWSPSGGSGKTTVALAYAAHKAANGKNVVYLNLENFSSTSYYFPDNGKSISRVFGKLESNTQMLLMGIRQQDSGSGISYFNGPENYDDINILSVSDIQTLVDACAAEVDELIIDLSSQCDERTQKVFELSDIVLLVCDQTGVSQKKLKQFIGQHNVFGRIRAKTVLINNKGAKITEESISQTMQLPLVQSNDAVSVYKMLSSGNFNW